MDGEETRVQGRSVAGLLESEPAGSSDQRVSAGSLHCFSGDGGSHRSAKARITEQWIEAGYSISANNCTEGGELCRYSTSVLVV